MRELKVACADRRNAVKWNNDTMTYVEFLEKLATPVRTSETVEEYASFSKDKRDSIKDMGGIVGGHLKGGRRRLANVENRSIILLDADSPEKEFLQRLEAADYAWVLYSTHSHTPESPRYRVAIPLAKDVLGEGYEPLARFVAADLGIDSVDPCSYRANQLMYWPSCPSDGEYIYTTHDGEWLDPDAVFDAHPDWKDSTFWPVGNNEKLNMSERAKKKQQDPLEKRGLIGAFNRLFYPIETLIETELSDVYERTEIEGRYTHIGSSTTAGAIVYNSLFLYSHHATDPASGMLLNAFDLYRVHRFGHLEGKESTKQALRVIGSMPEVRALIAEEHNEEAQTDFTELPAIPALPQQSEDLPAPIPMSTITEPPMRQPELIHGLLRRSHKMLISGPPKAGKSYLLMELAIAIAEGGKWLGFQCAKGKVLYINLEIDGASAICRLLEIYGRLGFQHPHKENLLIWNLRGYARPLDKLVPAIVAELQKDTFSTVIIDPIYKVITGDENNASDMGAFCNQFDKICTSAGVAAIYCHHHSKGAQGGKKAQDRASGSGVFSRDPDTQLDIIEIKKPKQHLTNVGEAEDADEEEDFDITKPSAWRMEAIVREFPPLKNIDFYFAHPVHLLDETGELASWHAPGSPEGNLAMSPKRTTKELRRKRLDTAYAALAGNPPVTLKDMAAHADISPDSMRRYIDEFSSDYKLVRGFVFEIPPLSNSVETEDTSTQK